MATPCGEKFCTNFLLVNVEEASFYDILCILLCSSSELNKRTFYDSSEENTTATEDFGRRWLIFISVLAQKLLLYVKNPMNRIGSGLEMWLNLLSSNGGLFSLLFNRLTGKVVKLEKSSPTYTSLVGEIDRREDLEKKIRKGDDRYNSELSVMAAKLSYENEAVAKTIIRDHWQMEFIGFYNCWNDYLKLNTTQAIMFQDKATDPNLIVVAFRGTSPYDADDWVTDVDISWYELEGIGKIHGGFMKALGLQKPTGWPKEISNDPQHIFAYYKIREKLRDILRKNENAKFIVTGHSLGGALAILFPGVLGLHEETWMLERMEGVYTYGQPRVGDGQFGKYMMEILRVHKVKYFRYVYCNDVVPRLPYDDKTQLFKHFGKCLYYNSFYKGQVLEEEPNKNYFSLVWFIPKYLNAGWELIRGFILPYWKGAEYKEGWFTKLLRVIGLVIPGLSAHCPDNYINITRLGSDLVQVLKQD